MEGGREKKMYALGQTLDGTGHANKVIQTVQSTEGAWV